MAQGWKWEAALSGWGTRSRGAEDGPQARQVSPGPRACAKGTGRENWVRRGQGSLREEGTAGTSGAGGEV